MISTVNQSGLVSQYETYFKKLAKADKVTVTEIPTHDVLSSTVKVRLEYSFDAKAYPVLFDQMEKASKDAAYAIECLQNTDALAALRTLKAFLAK